MWWRERGERERGGELVRPGWVIRMRRTGTTFSSGAADRLINARSNNPNVEINVGKPTAELLAHTTNPIDSRLSSVSSVDSIGLSGDVVPVHTHRSPTMSPRLTYLRMLSGRMVSAGLAPLEPPPGLVQPPPAYPPLRAAACRLARGRQRRRHALLLPFGTRPHHVRAPGALPLARRRYFHTDGRRAPQRALGLVGRFTPSRCTI